MYETLHAPIAPSNLPNSFYSDNARGDSRIIHQVESKKPAGLME